MNNIINYKNKCKFGVKCCDINCKFIHPNPRQSIFKYIS